MEHASEDVQDLETKTSGSCPSSLRKQCGGPVSESNLQAISNSCFSFGWVGWLEDYERGFCT